MAASVPIADRRWFRIGEWLAAVGSVLALSYYFAVSRGWIAGDSVVPHTLFELGALSCLFVGIVIRHRSYTFAIGAQLCAITCMVFLIRSMSRGQ